MRYSEDLRRIADRFRGEELDSTDENDVTVLYDDWTKMKVKVGQAKGGPYLSVHWRRKDFVKSHSKDIPSIEGTANQITALLEKLKLKKVFICTDGKDHEVEKLRSLLPNGILLKRFMPTKEILHKYLDGGVSIIDQWISAHARIQDDREILGFDPKTTFNRLCPDDDENCEQPAHWTLVQ